MYYIFCFSAEDAVEKHGISPDSSSPVSVKCVEENGDPIKKLEVCNAYDIKKSVLNSLNSKDYVAVCRCLI